MRIKGFILLLSSLLFMSFSKLAPTDLSCEHQQHPLIDNSTPQLSWKNISKDGGGKQSAYRIRVVKHEGGKSVVVWDSGKVISDKSLYIPYGGTPIHCAFQSSAENFPVCQRAISLHCEALLLLSQTFTCQE